MKKMSEKNLNLIIKCIPLACCVVCLLLMLFKGINYVSSSTLNGETITWDDGISLYSFLFNSNAIVLDSRVIHLRKIFGFSYVVMWLSFTIAFLSLAILVYSVFNDKSLFRKMGSIGLLFSLVLLILICFDSYKVNITVRYLTIFTPIYLICLFISILGLIVSFNKKSL